MDELHLLFQSPVGMCNSYGRWFPGNVDLAAIYLRIGHISRYFGEHLPRSIQTIGGGVYILRFPSYIQPL